MKPWCTPFWLVVFLFLANCKGRVGENASLTSLSSEELKDCGVFNGQRLLLPIMPETDFDNDYYKIINLFVQSMSDAKLTGHSYFMDAEGKISEPCRTYLLTEQAKYRLFHYLHDKQATSLAVIRGFEALGKEVRRLRTLAKQTLKPELQETHKIQIIIAVSSHGTNLNKNNPDCGIYLAPPAGNSSSKILNEDRAEYDIMKYRPFLELVAKNLMTNCQSDPQCKIAPENRLSDEIIFIIDNCYSGKFTETMRSYFSGLTGYDTDRFSRGQHATKIFSVTSSGSSQVSDATIAKSGYGTLYFMFDQMINFGFGDLGDKSNPKPDRNISLAEVKEYISDGSKSLRLSPLVPRLNDLVCNALLPKKAKALYDDYVISSPEEMATFLKIQ